MAESSSRMDGALGTQETEKGLRATEAKNEAVSKDVSCNAGTEVATGVKQVDLNEAKGYVDAVMSSQVCTEVNSPFQIVSGRKRHLSLPDEGSVKKLKNDSHTSERDIVRAKRSLYSKQKGQKNETGTLQEPLSEILSGTVETESESIRSKVDIAKEKSSKDQTCTSDILKAIQSMEAKMDNQFSQIRRNNDIIIKQLQEDIGNVRKEFNNRFEGLTKKVETKVGDTVNKKIEEKMSKLSNDLHEKSKKMQDKVNRVSDNLKRIEERTLPTVNETLGDEIDALRSRVNMIDTNLRKSPDLNNSDRNSQTNFIIRNLNERDREDITSEVNRLLKDGLKLRDIEIESAERKVNRANNGKAGIVLVKCKSREDKQIIMRSKSKLKDNRRYENVYIEHDLPKQQRVFNSNMRTIVNTLGRDKLQIRGSRIDIMKQNDDEYRATQDRGSHRDRNEGSARPRDSNYSTRSSEQDRRARNENRSGNESERLISNRYYSDNRSEYYHRRNSRNGKY